MKILVLQVTRFGDILCTLPVLSALRRENPEAEIHFLVRKRFAFAAESCANVDHLWRLDSRKILETFVGGSGQVSEALTALHDLVTQLRAQNFDKIINLSFSPSSSFLAHLIAREKIPVTGYSRTADLYLRIPDPAGEYFRAQAGVRRHNRIHVVELLGNVAGVDLHPSDYREGDETQEVRSGIICHLGASQKTKVWPESSWVALIRKLSSQGETVTIVGSKEERAQAEDVIIQATGEGKTSPRNVAGETNVRELVKIMSGARLFIGADSGPLHAAGLGGCPALNLSLGNVRFWETGPWVIGSRVLTCDNPSFLPSDQVYEQARQMLSGENTRTGYIECVAEKGVRYVIHPAATCPLDCWALVDWMYFQGPRPRVGGEVATALGQITDICDLAVTQLEKFHQTPQNREIVNILDRLDDLLEIFRSHITPLGPLLEAFRVMKENIPPASRDEVFFQTGNCYRRLQKLAGELLVKSEEHRASEFEAKG